jgi:hypothetical protein
MKITVRALRRIIKEALDVNSELNTIEIGDLVDVMVDEMGILPVRVIELVDDVNAEAGAPDDRSPDEFTGPGFVGEIDPTSGESGQLVFSLKQVVPGSKAKGYFPRMGTMTADDRYVDWDDEGRDALNPYRKAAEDFEGDQLHRPSDYSYT